MTEQVTRDEAVAQIMAMDSPHDQKPVEQEQTAQAAEDAPAVEDSSATTDDSVSEAVEPGDDVAGEETPSEEDAEEAAAEPVDAPTWWDAEAKAKFAELPPDLQDIVRGQEKQREAIVAKAKQEAGEARKGAEAKVKELESFLERASQTISTAETVFANRWQGVDADVWAEIAASDPNEYVRLRAEYDRDMQVMEGLRASQEQASKEAQAEHYKREGERLTEIAPTLASNPKALEALGNYIVKSGLPPEALANASADELVIAWKAQQWDDLQAKYKANPPVAPKAAPPKTVAPTARAQQLPPQQREVQQLKNRFNQTKSRDDAVALFRSGVLG